MSDSSESNDDRIIEASDEEGSDGEVSADQLRMQLIKLSLQLALRN